MTIAQARQLLIETIQSGGHITALTGAGISAQSGIPTFRGKDGFWTVGSREYHPQEMATFAMFSRRPESVWAWYLYRMGLCQQAQPNAGHQALVEMESALADQFTLVTQNVDNLHIRAGSSQERTYQIHGNIFQARCSVACTPEVYPLPSALPAKQKGEELSSAECTLLACPVCGSWLRPHVLWFDESYNEQYYRFDSTLQAARQTRLLITVGTAGATTLPNHVVNLVHQHGGTLIDINVADNPFAGVARQSSQGIFLQSPSSEALVELASAARSAQSFP